MLNGARSEFSVWCDSALQDGKQGNILQPKKILHIDKLWHI